MILGGGEVVVVPPGPSFTTAAPPAAAAVVVLPVAGPAGPRGTDGNVAGRASPLTFTGTWSSFSTAHPYGYPPDVWLVDATGEACDVAVEYPDASHVAITFPVPFTGTIAIG